MTTDADYAKMHASNEVVFALDLIDKDDPNRYRDIAEVLKRAAGRYEYLASPESEDWNGVDDDRR